MRSRAASIEKVKQYVQIDTELSLRESTRVFSREHKACVHCAQQVLAVLA
jgi:hypothetical protein